MFSAFVRIFLLSVLLERGFVHGQRVDIRDAPYMVAVHGYIDGMEKYFSGTILSEKFVLTVCVFDYGSRMHIRVGSNDAWGGEIIDASQSYTKESSSLTLLELARNIALDGVSKKAISLPLNPNESPATSKAYIYGFDQGLYWQGSHKLHRTEVSTSTSAECSDNADIVCVRGFGRRLIDGDPGKPLIRASDGIQIGIVWYSESVEGRWLDPEVHNIGPNLHWIRNVMNGTLSTAGFPNKLEPNGLVRTDGKRADGLTLTPWKYSRSLVWDATCVDTIASSYLHLTSKHLGAAANMPCSKKEQLYIEIAENHWGPSINYVTHEGGRGGTRFCDEM